VLALVTVLISLGIIPAVAMASPAHAGIHYTASQTALRTSRDQVTLPRSVPVIAAAMPSGYTVRSGDTLGKIAAAQYGSSRDWPALWWVNKAVVKDPDRLYAGEHLRLSAWHPALGWLLAAAERAEGASASPRVSTETTSAVHYGRSGGYPSSGVYSFSMLEHVWVWAGGPASEEWAAATIAECESGGNTHAYNPSGASGLWQILGVPFPGNPFDGPTNARMAVAKFRAAGGFSPWVCRA
jgi:LysM repeat protein